jgi:hypothetical protein
MSRTDPLAEQTRLAMTPREVNEKILSPAFALLPSVMDSPEARVMLLAIGGQESNLEYRRQVFGPARGLWQFERGGGVRGVLEHLATREHAKRVCCARNARWNPMAVWVVLDHDDILAAAFARLLLWTDPKPLPRIGDVDSAWRLYLRTWRPGKPHPGRWPAHYNAAIEAAQ